MSKSAEEILDMLRGHNFIKIEFDMNHSAGYRIVATQLLRKNVKEKEETEIQQRFAQATIEFSAYGNNLEECANRIIMEATYESRTGDVYEFPKGFYDN